MTDLENIIKKNIRKSFDYKVSSINFFKSALTHKSSSKDNYERLELLGDSVLQLAITDLLYKTYPESSDGKITVIRQNLVKSSTLSKIFLNLNLNNIFLLLNDKFVHKNVYPDVFEAVIGAIYLDSNFDEAARIVHHIFIPLLDESLANKDAKTMLQEYLQSKCLTFPVYTTKKSNRKDKKYLVICSLPDLKIQKSIHTDKVKDGQQDLASSIYLKLNA